MKLESRLRKQGAIVQKQVRRHGGDFGTVGRGFVSHRTNQISKDQQYDRAKHERKFQERRPQTWPAMGEFRCRQFPNIADKHSVLIQGLPNFKVDSLTAHNYHRISRLTH